MRDQATRKDPAAEEVAACLKAGVEAARGYGIDVCLCVTDSGGAVIGTLKMPGSFLASPDYARWKAWTAAGYKMSTTAFKELLTKLPADLSAQLVSHPEVTTLPGGLPVWDGDALLGAVGVSGGDAAQDDGIAEAAAAALKG